MDDVVERLEAWPLNGLASAFEVKTSLGWGHTKEVSRVCVDSRIQLGYRNVNTVFA